VCALTDSGIFKGRGLLCYVTDRRSLSPNAGSGSLDPLVRKIQELVAAGVEWVQIREKDLSGKELAHITEEAVRSAGKYSREGLTTRILVNDRLDVALSEDAGGIHLRENSAYASDVQRLVTQVRKGAPHYNFLIGVSCHSREGAVAAAESGADYLFFGPVFATPSKAAFGAPQGLKRLEDVCGSVSVPVMAIGGISLENAASCIAAGAAGIAAIRLFQDAPDTRSQVAALRILLSTHLSHPGTDR
jgi:thiamine-phosphate pyrophosphorylase